MRARRLVDRALRHQAHDLAPRRLGAGRARGRGHRVEGGVQAAWRRGPAGSSRPAAPPPRRSRSPAPRAGRRRRCGCPWRSPWRARRRPRSGTRCTRRGTAARRWRSRRRWGGCARGPKSGVARRVGADRLAQSLELALPDVGEALALRAASRRGRRGRPGSAAPVPTRSPRRRASATQSSIVAPSSGTKGTTSVAPIRGCSPVWRVRSMRSRAVRMARNAASTAASGGATKVKTER